MARATRSVWRHAVRHAGARRRRAPLPRPADRRAVHLARAGPADAPPVLALHGWPQHWWSWRARDRARWPASSGCCARTSAGSAGRAGRPTATSASSASPTTRSRCSTRSGSSRAPGRPRLGRLGGDPRRADRARALLEPARDVDRPSVGAGAGRRPQRLPARATSCRSRAARRRARDPRRALRAQDAEAGRRDGSAGPTHELDTYVDVLREPQVATRRRSSAATSSRASCRARRFARAAARDAGAAADRHAASRSARSAAGCPGRRSTSSTAPAHFRARGGAAGRRRAHPRDVEAAGYAAAASAASRSRASSRVSGALPQRVGWA